MFKCEKCGEVFISPSVEKSRNEVEYWGSISYEDYEEEVCPYCGCDEFEEAIECVCCGEYFIPNECERVCEECTNEYASNFDIVYKAFDSDDDRQTVKLNPMITSMLSEEQMSDILVAYIRDLCKQGYRSVEAFASEGGISCFAERLGDLEEVKR